MACMSEEKRFVEIYEKNLSYTLNDEDSDFWDKLDAVKSRYPFCPFCCRPMSMAFNTFHKSTDKGESSDIVIDSEMGKKENFIRMFSFYCRCDGYSYWTDVLNIEFIDGVPLGDQDIDWDNLHEGRD